MCIKYWMTREPTLKQAKVSWEKIVLDSATAVRSFPWPSAENGGNADDKAVRMLVNGALPTVMTGSPASQWQALEEWTDAHLGKAIGAMKGVVFSTSPQMVSLSGATPQSRAAAPVLEASADARLEAVAANQKIVETLSAKAFLPPPCRRSPWRG